MDSMRSALIQSMVDHAVQPNDYMFLALLVGDDSSCVCRKVGCVIVDKQGRVLSMAHNSPLNNISCESRLGKGGCLNNPPGTSSPAVHAEVRAIVNALTLREHLQDSYIYLTHSPCISCAKLIAYVDVRKVVYLTLVSTEGLDYLNSVGIETERRQP